MTTVAKGLSAVTRKNEATRIVLASSGPLYPFCLILAWRIDWQLHGLLNRIQIASRVGSVASAIVHRIDSMNYDETLYRFTQLTNLFLRQLHRWNRQEPWSVPTDHFGTSLPLGIQHACPDKTDWHQRLGRAREGLYRSGWKFKTNGWIGRQLTALQRLEFWITERIPYRVINCISLI